MLVCEKTPLFDSLCMGCNNMVLDNPARGNYFKPMLSSLRSYFLIPISGQDPEKMKLFWLVRLRWVAIVFLAIVSGPGYFYHYLDASSFPVFVGAVGVLLGYNLITQGFWLDSVEKLKPAFVLQQLLVDLLAFASLLMISGGIANPFYVFFYIILSLGAVLLSGSRAFVFLASAHAVFLAVQLMSLWGESLPVAHLLVQHFVLFTSFVLSSSLGKSLDSHRERLYQFKSLSEKQDRLRALGALSAGFSHEFASPLHAIKLRLEREAKSNVSENIKQALLAVKDCEQVLAQMNQAQLDSRENVFQKMRIKKFLEQITAAWLEDFSDCEIITTIDKDFECEIPAINFSQVLFNLFDNAYEASEYKKITMNVKVQGEKFILEIRDSGEGFSADVLKRFGEPFVTTKADGTGLGLYTAKLFAESMGGDFLIFNHEDKGAAAVLQLPLLKDV